MAKKSTEPEPEPEVLAPAPEPEPAPAPLATDGPGEKTVTVYLWGEGDTYTPVLHHAATHKEISIGGQVYTHAGSHEGAWFYRNDRKN